MSHGENTTYVKDTYKSYTTERWLVRYPPGEVSGAYPPCLLWGLGSSNLTHWYLAHFLAPGRFWIRYWMVGCEKPKNSGPDPVLDASRPLMGKATLIQRQEPELHNATYSKDGNVTCLGTSGQAK